MNTDTLLALLYIFGILCFVQALRIAPRAAATWRSHVFAAAGASLFVAVIVISLIPWG
ncbi:hypothetical protein [Azospirillum thermophilum]|uniref:hypothetical protein n=1 Tax=Azospirillum thermophilum TaxID=2202148 RepID=UPI00143D8310|nr:hypothetical protein [Azospirillum thermophilum]